jgi:hypothetical protein
MNKIIAITILIAISLNLILPHILKPFASESEIKPPSGAGSLSLKGQFMHMMVHHNQVPLSSSIIIALIVGISVSISLKL